MRFHRKNAELYENIERRTPERATFKKWGKKKRNEQRKKSEKEDKRDWSSVGDDFYDVKTGKTVQDCQILQKGPIR